MKVTAVNSMLLIEQFDKGKRRSEGSSPFVSVISSANLGIVKYSANEAEYPCGSQVYFGSEYQKLLVEGAEVLAMKESNVIAKLTE